VELVIHNHFEYAENKHVQNRYYELNPIKKKGYHIYQLKGSSSPYEPNRASPTGGRRPLPFKRDLMGLSLSSYLVEYTQLSH
jgi:hypothetical protein